MSKQNGIYKCNTCGNIAQIIITGKPDMKCCARPMVLLSENSEDAAVEKHVPVIEKLDNGFKVVVGSNEHPMADDHYIQWIEFQANNRTYRTLFNSGDKPEAVFLIDADSIAARAYCNLHGLWKA